MALVCIVIAWICGTATDLKGKAAPPRKAHGDDAKSWFRGHLNELRRRMRTDLDQALAPFVKALKSPGAVSRDQPDLAHERG
jgi:hypothetical protein